MRKLLTIFGGLGLMALCAAVVPIGSAQAAMQAGYSTDAISSHLGKNIVRSGGGIDRDGISGSIPSPKALAPERGGVVKAGAPGDRSSLNVIVTGTSYPSGYRGGLRGTGGIETLNVGGGLDARRRPHPS